MNTPPPTPPHPSSSPSPSSSPGPIASTGTCGSAPLSPDQAALLQAVESRARAAKVFGAIAIKDNTLVCTAANSAAPAEYRLFVEGGRWWIALVTPDRWLSESVESGMLEGRDKIEELIEEELVELGLEHKVEKVEHFRSPPPQKLYTFRFKVPAPQAGQTAEDMTTTYLLATEAAFRLLGDMDAGPGNAG